MTNVNNGNNGHEAARAEMWHGTARVSIGGAPTQLIEIQGDVDLANAYEIFNGIRTSHRPDVDHVVVDLGAITYLDSAGLAMLVRMASRLASARTTMTVVSPPESVASRVIALSGLTEELSLRHDSPPA